MFASNLNQLLEVVSSVDTTFGVGKNLEQRLTGRFYTHEKIGKAMAIDVASRLDARDDLKIIDPFCGDGRLLCWLLEAMHGQGKIPLHSLQISAWDCDSGAVEVAKKAILRKLKDLGVVVAHVDVQVLDSFWFAVKHGNSFDVCITNPPWETIKPDNRELAKLDSEAKEKYVSLLKEQVSLLEVFYPHSKPLRKFSGWGANLARCGIEASVQLVAPEGYFSVVAPATIFGDQISAPLRAWLFSQNTIDAIHHYPAEANLFEGVDQSAVYFLGCKVWPREEHGMLEVVQHLEKNQGLQSSAFKIPISYLEENNYAIGFNGSQEIARAMPYFADLLKLGDYECGNNDLFKIGRELDETRIAEKLSDTGVYQFIKGRQVTRYSQTFGDVGFLNEDISPPKSSALKRIVWRDVARQSSIRRVIATVINPGVVTGNSLNVLVPKKMSDEQMLALLAVFNSIVFESQVRASISTNHLSVGAMRRIKVPNLFSKENVKIISELVRNQLREPSESCAAEIELQVANWYSIPHDVYLGLLAVFDKNFGNDISEIKRLIELDWNKKHAN
ncbi:N-6 DNA methylase [Pantoea sp. 18069]|uniref:Eco57I restriction-modification methylase domain-containing protein n=1 Tax=Pantoea sp. 18069 TaxID=2681415 RepID=UPI00135BFBFB|nr:N-6 DNA methylase [Pantoea sp. 18069]